MHEWRRKPLGNVAEIRPSNVDKKSNLGEQPVRLCNYMDVYTGDYITEDIPFMEATATTSELQRFRVDLGDVLITKDSETPDDIGISAVVLDDIPNLVCGYHLALLKPNRELVDPVYLAKQLASSESARYFGRLANGSTRYGLSYGSIAATPIRLAPLVQQRRIAEVLVTVDEAITQTEALIAKTQQIKVGLMHDLFTRGVTPDGQLRPPREKASRLYKESPLGWIPKEWDIRQLRSCLLDNPTNGIYKPAHLIGRGTLLIGQAAFTAERSIDFALSRRAVVTDEELRRYGVAAENILVSRVFATVEGVGQPTLVPPLPEPAVYESNMMRLRVDQSAIRPRLLFEWLRSRRARQRIEGGVNASNQASVNQGVLNPLPVLWQPPEEQDRLVRVIEEHDERYAAEQATLAKLQSMKRGLMEDLLTGRVRVPIADAQKVAANV